MTDVDREWYLRRKDGEGSVGPFGTEQLSEQWQKGILDDAAEAWKEGMPDWRPIAEIEPFASLVRVAPDSPGIVRFGCECGNQIVMSDKYLGRLAKCQACGRTVTVYDPSQEPELEPLPKKKERTEAGLPPWLIPVCAVAGVVIVAVTTIFLVFGGSDSATADAKQETGSRIARARNEVLSDMLLDPPDRTRPKAARTNPTAEEPEDSLPAPAVDQPDDSVNTGSSQPKVEAPRVADPEPEPDEESTQAPAGLEERNLRKLASEYAEAFRTENPTPIERVEELLADDCVLIPSRGGLIQGKEAVLQAINDAIIAKRAEFRKLKVRFTTKWTGVFADIAVMCGEWKEEGALKARGRPVKRTLWQTIVLRKIGGEWRIIQAQATPTVRSAAPAG